MNQYQKSKDYSSIRTPLIHNENKKLHNPKIYRDVPNSTHSNRFIKLCSYLYALMMRLCPCCFQYKIKHICYFKDENLEKERKLEDIIRIENNYIALRDYLALTFWGEPNHEEVFFSDQEQIIINEMKEKIKKCE
jgi:hypothetical protein